MKFGLIVLLHPPREGLLSTYRARIRYSGLDFPPGQASSVSEFISSFPFPISSPPCYANLVHFSLNTRELTLDMEENKNMLYKKITQYLQCLFHSKSSFL